MRNCRCRGELAFHLLECLCALALSAVLLSFSILSLTGIAAQRRLKDESLRLYQAAVDAASRARAEELEMMLLVTKRGYELRRAGDGGINDVVDGAVLLRREFPVGVSIEGVGLEGKQLSFYGSGVATPATLSLVNGESSCRIIVSLRGRVRSTCNV